MARTFTGYASAYSANQSQARRVMRRQTRTVTANFNGAIDADRTIAAVTWACTSPWSTEISNPAIATDGRSVTVDVLFNYAGVGFLKATVTLDNGDQTNYEFYFTVTDCPIYPSEVYPESAGVYSVSAP